MARSFSTTLVQAMNAAQTDTILLALLEISHPALTTIRLVNNTVAVTSNGQSFQAFPFSVVLPPSGPDATPVAQVAVSNIDRQVVEAARSVAGSAAGLAAASLYIVAHDDPDTRLLSFEDYRVQNLRYTAEILSFDMTLEWFENEPYPAMTFTPGRFRGVF